SPSIVRRRSAPARQIDRILASNEGEALFDRLGKIILDALARDLAAQEVRPQEFAERGGVLGKPAGAAQLAGEATKRIVLEVDYRFRQFLEMPAFALGVVGIDPALVVHHAPEGVALD